MRKKFRRFVVAFRLFPHELQLKTANRRLIDIFAQDLHFFRVDKPNNSAILVRATLTSFAIISKKREKSCADREIESPQNLRGVRQ